MNTEKIIISCILNNNKVYDIFTAIEPSDFGKNINALLYGIIVKYYQKNGFVPTADILKKTIMDSNVEDKEIVWAYAKKIVKVEKVSDVNFYVDSLLQKSQKKSLLLTLNNAAEMYKKGDIGKCLEYINKKTSKSLVKLANNYLREGGYLDGFENRLRNIIIRKFGKESDHLFAVPTGIENFDNYFSGLMPGELGLVRGGTGVGKSVMLLNFAANAFLANYNVVIVTIEMPKTQYEYRMDSRLCALSNRKIRLADLSSREIKQWREKIKDLKKEHTNKLHIIDPRENITVSKMKNKLLSIKNIIGENYLLVVDYLNLLESEGYRGSQKDWQAQDEVAQSMKMLARELSVPIWSAVQFSSKRAKDDVRGVEGTAYSGGINNQVDIMMDLIQTEEDLLDGQIRFRCSKGREGKCLETLLHTSLDKMILLSEQEGGIKIEKE